uniref:Uncharacterized protein n=1 Tax=Minutocellus polymorphus TaxID=265543 RepID=A0A7S0FMZ8_9STRA|mmetsp:Transcript_2100/g.3528  ORF Transcript_2100/g.3528 Transcript_2100/m.3528 type:complete len:290 (+) Transcript_2100:54-923(+)|eukprot:CAMPEP_0197724800 /NCGR_PEP_ID=MMETSP1434-20131217/6574_1 /TAXON_ID=265543 /ORGANISM="Minutocellus polymorphus, Strain CCMP3303" /LENGTH=289 /DNA_ID=CAMNT_0043310197 /DNA_START=28 /DNA_END=897 /DNA_ORIENTATION=-
MNLRLLFSSAALALVLVSPGTAATPFLPTGAVSKNVDTSLAIRGGAGPLDVELTAKAATGIFGLQGLYNYLAPEKNHDAYGFEQSVDGLAIWMSTGVGAQFLTFAIAAYFSLFHNMPALKACGAGLIVCCVENLRSVLNDTASKNGVAGGGQVLNLVIHSFVAYALLSEVSFAETVGKAFGAWLIVACLQARLAPATCLKTWGFDGDASDSVILYTKTTGQAGVAFGAFIGSIANGAEVTSAIGYYSVAVLLSLAEMVASGYLEDLGLSKDKVYPWLAILLAFVGTLAV